MEEVELFLNGRSLGVKPCQRYGHLVWDVAYQPGVLEARGRRNGKVIVIDRRETTGQPVRLKLTAEQTNPRADGEDLIIVRVEALDKRGRFVPTANVPLRFSVSGVGRFLGVGNGNPTCLEADNEPRRSLFNGLAQVIAKVGTNSGVVTITAEAEAGHKLTSAKLEITVTAAKARPRV